MRCNLVNPICLTNQHLIAEKRELKIIPALLRKRIMSGKHSIRDIPDKFCLGVGHQKFWLNKMLYLSKRYNAIIDEMLERNFNVDSSLKFDLTYACPFNMDNDWKPTIDDYNLIVSRLREKLLLKLGWYRYFGQSINREWIESMYPIPYY